MKFSENFSHLSDPEARQAAYNAVRLAVNAEEACLRGKISDERFYRLLGMQGLSGEWKPVINQLPPEEAPSLAVEA